MLLIALVPLALLTRHFAVQSSRLPVGDLDGWRQVVAEDFDTDVALGGWQDSEYAERTLVYDGLTDTFDHGVYRPEKVLSVRDGKLDWFLHSENGVGNVAAVVIRMPSTGWGQLYGRYSVRFKSDTIPGYKMAFLLWPDSDNWGEGEIDFPEAHAFEPGQRILANMFSKGNVAERDPGPSTGFVTGVEAADSGWHVATIEWLPTGVTFILDGKSLGTKTVDVPDTLMHWVLQVETSSIGPAADPSATGHVSVDWVAAYERS